MDQWNVWNVENGLTAIILCAVLVVLLIMLIWIIALSVQLKRTKRRFSKVIGNSSADNVDEVLLNMQASLQQLQATNEMQQKELSTIRGEMKKMKSRVGIHRYNAFAQQGGSDMSFSIAILDDEKDGLVLTGIHSREESYMYAKPVEKGQSSYSLSPEEKQVIDQAAGAVKR